MAMNEADRQYIREEIGTVREDIKGLHKRIDPVCTQVAKNTTDIKWLKWNQRKAISIAAGGAVAACVAIILALVGVG